MNTRMPLLTALLPGPLAAQMSWLILLCGGILPPAVAEQPVQGVLSAVSYPSIQAGWTPIPAGWFTCRQAI